MMVTVMVDASFCPDTGAGGYGVWIAAQRGKRAFEGQFNTPLDNSTLAEMAAVVNALHCALKHGYIMESDTVLLQIDCIAAIHAFENKRVVRHNMEHEIKAKYNKFIELFKLDIKFKHVKAHSGKLDRRSRSNNACDQRAYKQMKLMRQRLKLAEIRRLLKC